MGETRRRLSKLAQDQASFEAVARGRFDDDLARTSLLAERSFTAMRRSLRNQPEHPVSKQPLELADRSGPDLSESPAVILVSSAAQTSTIAARPLLERVLAARPDDPGLQKELSCELRCIHGYYEDPPPPGEPRMIL